MDINHFEEWKDIPIYTICKKRHSAQEQERIWYQEWRNIHINIINMLANYLNRKNKNWDKGLDEKNITTAELIAHMRSQLEKMGIDFEGRVSIVTEEYQKLKR